MGDDGRVTRRTVLAGAAGAAIAASLPGGTALARGGPHRPPPLWRTAAANGIVFGTAYSTRLSEDADYVDLVDREAALLFTEGDLLWYKLKPTPESDLDFSFADQFMAFRSSTASSCSARIWSGTRASATGGATSCGSASRRRSERRGPGRGCAGRGAL
jgi:hypothetical protein